MNSNHEISEGTKKLVRLGLASKGAIYMLIGILAILPVIGMGQGGGNGGSKQAIQWLMEQSYGIVIVALIALGLIFYAIWRFIRAFKNSPNYTGTKGTIKRIGMAISGLMYGGFAVYAGSLVVKALSGSGGSSSGSKRYQLIQDLMQSGWGRALLIAIGVTLIARSIYFIYQALSGKYKEKVENYGVKEEYKEYLIKAGKIGFIARGIVFSIIGYFLISGTLNHNSNSASTSTGGAMDFIQSTGGNILLLVIAIGLMCYGIFMFMQARYRNIESII